jgi:Big-like domain-containing protein/concanavalin A-like lectin/glucanase superfamily protein
MKTQTIFVRLNQLFALSAVAAALSIGTTARAGLQVPYTPDADTLHLWHFDDSIANQGTTSFVTVTDAVATASITLTNYGFGTNVLAPFAAGNQPGSPPYTNIFLSTQSATANLLGCLNILVGGGTGGNVGKAYAWCGTSNNVGGYFPDTTSFKNNSSGAFSFEALVYVQGPVFSTSIGTEWEIFCGDSQGESGGRSWQFRMQPGTTPSMNINFITAVGGASPNVSPLIPLSGPNALSISNWYHVAVTYTGNTPTNGDGACELRFYWTYFDAFRTNADLMASFTNLAWGTLGGGPIPAVGGSARRNNGVGNSGAFEGLIDEVRISAVARKANEMAFISGGPQNPPSFVSQPAASTLVGYGKALSVSTLLTGSLPRYPQWQATNSTSGGWTNVPNQTDSTLLFDPVAFINDGIYRLIVTNAFGSVTSTVARVIVGASFSELFNTGVAADGTLPAGGGSVDPHYTIRQSSDIAHLGPDTIIWNMAAFPVLPSGVFSLVAGASQWIGPQANVYTSPQGQYVYRTTFLIDSADLGQPATLSGTWWENTTGLDIVLNGQSKGILSQLTNSPGTGANFIITNGFVAGVNILDFVTDCVNPNGSYPESAIRIEIGGVGRALAPALPTIATQPADQAVRDGAVSPGSIARFSVVALGRPPLSYQWYGDNALITDATNRALTYNSPSTGAQPTNFKVVIANDSGSVTSQVAVLTLIATNQLPIAPGYSFTIYSNQTLNVNASALYLASSDPDNDPFIIAFDSFSTNFGSLTANGVILTYTPPADYVGPDSFNYYISDNQAGTTTAAININILQLLAPTVSFTQSGGNLVLNGTGGAPGGGYSVLSSTDLSIPVVNWPVASSGTFDGSGSFSVTNAISVGTPQRYYIIRVP